MAAEPLRAGVGRVRITPPSDRAACELGCAGPRSARWRGGRPVGHGARRRRRRDDGGVDRPRPRDHLAAGKRRHPGGGGRGPRYPSPGGTRLGDAQPRGTAAQRLELDPPGSGRARRLLRASARNTPPARRGWHEPSLRPARVAAGSGQSQVAVNRREIAPDGRPVTGVNPEGPIDPQVFVLRIDDAEGGPLAAVVGYTMHPTTLGPSNRLISPDWPGHLKRTVEAITGVDLPLRAGRDRQHRTRPRRLYGRRRRRAPAWRAGGVRGGARLPGAPAPCRSTPS